MQRRVLLGISVAATVFRPSVLLAQKPLPVIGYLGSATRSTNATLLPAFHLGLGETGFVEGKNVAIEYRWAEDRYERLPALAAELAARKVDVIVSTGGVTGALAAKNAAGATPIVFITGDDPVERGLVASLARPDGNLTGASFLTLGLTPKRLDLLHELVIGAGAVGLLVNPKNAGAGRATRSLQAAAQAKGIKLHVLEAGAASEIDAAFAALARLGIGGLVVSSDPYFFSRRDQLAALAARAAVPAIFDRRGFAEAGGLISYGPSFPDTWRQVGVYAGKILKGAKPADLPVQQPTKFELVINLKTAKALGLTPPPTLLARADEVIE